MLPGVHEIRVYAEDEDGVLSDPLIFEIEVNELVIEQGTSVTILEFITEGNPLILGGTLLADCLL